MTEFSSLVTYPISIPTLSGVVAITWQKQEVRAISTSPFTYERQVFKHSGDRWVATVTLPLMTRESAGAWSSFFLNLDGGYGSFWFGDVFNPEPMGSALGVPVVDGSSNAGRVVDSRGWTANTSGILKAGDRIQIGNCLYQITKDVDSDSSGEAPLLIWPRLRATPADGSTIVTSSPKGLFVLSNPDLVLSTINLRGGYTMPSFDILEAL